MALTPSFHPSNPILYRHQWTGLTVPTTVLQENKREQIGVSLSFSRKECVLALGYLRGLASSRMNEYANTYARYTKQVTGLGLWGIPNDNKHCFFLGVFETL